MKFEKKIDAMISSDEIVELFSGLRSCRATLELTEMYFFV
jgi:hypothetical protein